MTSKKKKTFILQRLFFWLFYFFSGFILYSKEENLFPFLIKFTRVVYPLSIFWLQIRLKGKEKFLPIDPSMSTSQLWFNIIPVFASFFAVILSITNFILYIIEKFINT